MTRKISILGAGAWGTALACVASRAGNETVIWGRDKAVITELNENRKNTKYLGDLNIAEHVRATTDLVEAVSDRDIILLCVPTQTLADMLRAIKPHIGDAVIISCCKGIDRNSEKLPAELVSQEFANNKNGVLSGPSFATDVVQDLPTAVTIASEDTSFAAELALIFSDGNFRCYASNDVKGVELGGALKNVLALGVGTARGMQLGASAEAALIARGFAEIKRIAVALGSNSETLNGLSGLGDLVLTCSSPQSRNFRYGMAMGENEPLDEMPLAEGAHTAEVALRIAKRHNIDTPIIEVIVNVLEKRLTAREAIHALLTRPLKRES